MSGRTRDFLQVEVSDTGIGMSREARARLFAPFEQADRSTTRRFGGTGLGLAISKQLIELMDGEVGVASEVGVGTTFWFTARMAEAPAAEREQRRRRIGLAGRRMAVISSDGDVAGIIGRHLLCWGVDARRMQRSEAAQLLGHGVLQQMDLAIVDQRGATDDCLLTDLADAGVPLVLIGGGGGSQAGHVSGELRKASLLENLRMAIGLGPMADESIKDGAESPLAGLRVLVAEDNPVNQKVISALLGSLQCEAWVVQDGVAAVEFAARERFDVILMDYQMPTMDGPEAARQIRAAEEARGDGRRVPIVALTANAGVSYQQVCALAGMDEFLAKPVRRETLAVVLAAVVGEREPHASF